MRGDRVYDVPFARRGSVLDDTEFRALTEVLHSDAPLSMGKWRTAFEDEFRTLVGARHALSVTSGTVALEIAIALLDLRPGDEVVASPQTFQATIQPLLDLDVRVRFCDVDPYSLNMDPNRLADLITERTRAVLLVHYGGWPAEMEAVMDLARARGIVVLEDCAHALGAEYRGRRPGALADIACFSFHSSKNITTLGEGGMITTDRDDWAERIERRRSNQVDGVFTGSPAPPGDVPALLPWMQYSAYIYRESCEWVRRSGTNATLSEAAAAVGLAQLAKLDAFVARRRQITARLDEVASAHPGVRVQRPGSGIGHAHHLYTCFVPGGPEARTRLVRALDERGVEIQLRYFPLHLVPEWRTRGHGPGECPTAERLWFTEQLNLPCHPGLTDRQVDHLVEAFSDSLDEVLPVGAMSLPRQGGSV
ncbi:DegT/DnrJ/EryC1/StrS family aminotransferase [Streptomyces griseoviridis]|uniref:UDP-4-amino-4, 6-dideoxy-N-acetyl-beta-L-altrosamine transaminase n=3 Tax=Streptomyces TaxID=1883 RepID=A0A918GTF2_STRGD|nr:MULTISPECIES: DegT/DnrJ/EryC1/StrS family aminotransferase [Streptomyces]MDP9685002.1 dTDP-4-amino-4,6-dideoxygalactose transaminase [Streptomyces griseoviridis]GGS60343.1 UDP-4-amino-4,6-dideoxy-N-acetyl-beta-L-altrosamine transaminase [Streptomyces niveoruber]GGT21495.1 UDP-4-amino-4,6-dideoxy-N-acetyl-beta-L-altrosamine transaminase [Streptomyces griseoviridis]GGU57936.1 UDP-4-amino-4,6-dideoxy-N-acetyl-beta-L-altrosamine transaminase [Streptomyces daghestanicus]GHI33492.1 UDP-4-amino-4,